MRPIDLRSYKKELRAQSFKRRASLSDEEKKKADEAILCNVGRLKEYRVCNTVLVYVSLPGEVDTFGIIEKCFADGKRVAVPRCVPGTRDMVFHYIENTESLKPGAFGVLEPDETLPAFDEVHSGSALALLPALAADHFGFRVGYGKGYYDRYMSRFIGNSAIICYSDDVRHRLLHGHYDTAAGVLVTENYIRTIK